MTMPEHGIGVGIQSSCDSDDSELYSVLRPAIGVRTVLYSTCIRTCSTYSKITSGVHTVRSMYVVLSLLIEPKIFASKFDTFIFVFSITTIEDLVQVLMINFNQN